MSVSRLDAHFFHQPTTSERSGPVWPVQPITSEARVCVAQSLFMPANKLLAQEIRLILSIVAEFGITKMKSGVLNL